MEVSEHGEETEEKSGRTLHLPRPFQPFLTLAFPFAHHYYISVLHFALCGKQSPTKLKRLFSVEGLTEVCNHPTAIEKILKNSLRLYYIGIAKLKFQHSIQQ